MGKSAENLRDVENPDEKSIAKSKISAENLHGKSCGKIGGEFCGRFAEKSFFFLAIEQDPQHGKFGKSETGESCGKFAWKI